VADEKAKNPYVMPLRDEDWNEVLAVVRKTPRYLFHLRGFRALVAQRRAAHFQHKASVDQVPETSISYTIDWNTQQLESYVEAHVDRLIAPLSVLDPVFERKRDVTLLSIGPRNEMELLLLYYYHFDPRNIKAIDLISNSPLIDIGDMHAIPHPDSSFDVVLCSWTLVYSRKHDVAVSEMIRVCRDRGLIAIGLTRIPPDHPDHALLVKEGSVSYQTIDEVLALFGPHIEEVPFRHEPFDRSKKGALMAIVRVRKDASGPAKTSAD
jgi:hypothetical protein